MMYDVHYIGVIFSLWNRYHFLVVDEFEECANISVTTKSGFTITPIVGNLLTGEDNYQFIPATVL